MAPGWRAVVEPGHLSVILRLESPEGDGAEVTLEADQARLLGIDLLQAAVESENPPKED